MKTRILLAALVAMLLALGAAAPAQAGVDPWFHSDCEFSHRAQVDPVKEPGETSEHMHDFVGNRATNAFSTTLTLQWHPENTTCARDDERNVPRTNGSSYWFPTPMQDGEFVTVTSVTAGYGVQSGGDHESVVPFPRDHVMVSHHAMSGNVGAAAAWRYRCGGQTLQPGTATRAPLCATPDLRHDINFPECGDGRSDSPDHRSHMAYSVKSGGQWVCPASHPILYPRVRLLLRIPAVGGAGYSNSAGGIQMSHADRMNAWAAGKLEQLNADCINAGRYCGGTSAPVKF